MEKLGLSMFAAFCAVHGDDGAAVREWGGVGVGVRVQERVLDGLVRARCVVVQRVRLAGDRVVGRGCRRGAMGQRGGGKIYYKITIYYYIFACARGARSTRAQLAMLLQCLIWQMQ